MMGKTSKRPGRASRDIHEAIRAAAEELKAGTAGKFRSAAAYPEADALLRKCREVLTACIPRSVPFEGRPYWLRVQMAATFEIFAAPGDAEPLLIGVSYSTDEHGHQPGH